MKLSLSIHCCFLTIFALSFTRRAVSSFTPTVSFLRSGRLRALYSSSEVNEEDLQKWEKLYYEGTSPTAAMDDSNAIEYYSTASEVRVVTFDLDNCLWKTGATISAANDALAQHLKEQNITQPVRVEKKMGELFKASPETYSPNGGKAPVLLTLLRKRAIQQLLEEHNDFSEEDAIKFANEAFDVWTKARHDVIPQNFATAVVECLQEIRDLPTSSGQPILIGAVTDGNSDPRNVEELSHLFDFCVNAESVGVGKPNKKLYMEAISIVTSHEHVEDIFGAITLSEEATEDVIGPWWVHVGDDFIKDVVPAKELKMRSVWARELIVDKLKKEAAEESMEKPEKSMEDFVKEVANKKVIEMSVGADDYLVDSIRSEFADAVVDNFGEVGAVLSGWQERAMRLADRVRPNGEVVEAEPEMVAVVEVSSAASEKNESKETTDKEAKKFCMYCGVKLPVAAKFCSSCGEKQPEI